MPVLFVHGVNTRVDDPSYRRDVAARDQLFARLVLARLNEKYAKLPIVNAYWGQFGARFRWNLATVPKARLTQMGTSDTTTIQSDAELEELTRATKGRTFKEAALADLPRFMEAVLAPIILSEIAADGSSPVEVGNCEAVLLIVADEVAQEPATFARISTAHDDNEVLEILKTEVTTRLDRQRGDAGERREMGPGWVQGLKDRTAELFQRARSAPSRSLSLAALKAGRDSAHRSLSRFFGDVFVYLAERGTRDAPGPIPTAILDSIATNPQKDEPLIFITHSMGGNIVYDLITYFRPELYVTAWISVGGQIGQFEEMKLFAASDKNLEAPRKVPRIENVGTWINVYDPADVLSFLAAPVFSQASDIEYSTGGSAFSSHGGYFKRPSFHRMLQTELEESLP